MCVYEDMTVHPPLRPILKLDPPQNNVELIMEKNEEKKNTTLSLSHKKIDNLPLNLDEFIWIINLDLSNNELVIIDALPPLVERLNLSYNSILEIADVLPITLESLNIFNNALVTLPPLPGGLTELDCSENKIEQLPEDLPNKLVKLSCNLNELVDLPTLPESLLELNCSQNNLTELSVLPKNLVELYCSNNTLTIIEDLPLGLEVLECYFNQIIRIGEFTPFLVSIDCSHNCLTKLPPLPNKLEKLDCSSNEITNIMFIPSTIKQLICTNNDLIEQPQYRNAIQMKMADFTGNPCCNDTDSDDNLNRDTYNFTNDSDGGDDDNETDVFWRRSDDNEFAPLAGIPVGTPVGTSVDNYFNRNNAYTTYNSTSRNLGSPRVPTYNPFRSFTANNKNKYRIYSKETIVL
jgi:Leucine-rich repeat (LRR) protein